VLWSALFVSRVQRRIFLEYIFRGETGQVLNFTHTLIVPHSILKGLAVERRRQMEVKNSFTSSMNEIGQGEMSSSSFSLILGALTRSDAEVQHLTAKVGVEKSLEIQHTIFYCSMILSLRFDHPIVPLNCPRALGNGKEG
jgi:hypothetical protein